MVKPLGFIPLQQSLNGHMYLCSDLVYCTGGWWHLIWEDRLAIMGGAEGYQIHNTHGFHVFDDIQAIMSHPPLCSLLWYIDATIKSVINNYG
jgi:hypothetical protein